MFLKNMTAWIFSIELVHDTRAYGQFWKLSCLKIFAFLSHHSMYTIFYTTFCLLKCLSFLKHLSLSNNGHNIHLRPLQRELRKDTLGYTAYIWDMYNQSYMPPSWKSDPSEKRQCFPYQDFHCHPSLRFAIYP